MQFSNRTTLVKIENFTLAKDTSGGTNKADIIFVLDVTGSMTNEINGVKENIVEFADSLSAQGIDFRLGMVTFLDEVENIPSINVKKDGIGSLFC